MLVVFSSAASASPSASPFSLAGFQLEVSVRFVEAGAGGAVIPRDGSTGAPARDCRFSFSSAVRGRGVVTSLQHSLPANTSCSWQFQVQALSFCPRHNLETNRVQVEYTLDHFFCI